MKIILSLIIVIAVIFGGYYLYQKFHSPIVPAQVMNESSSTVTTNSIPGWQTCNSPSFGFEFQYPPNWNVYGYSTHEGAGNIPVEGSCDTFDSQDIDGLTFASVPSGNSSGWLHINQARVLPQYLDNSTTTLGGQPSYVKSDGSVFAGGYQLSFSSSTPTSTRNSILNSFEFITGSSTSQ